MRNVKTLLLALMLSGCVAPGLRVLHHDARLSLGEGRLTGEGTVSFTAQPAVRELQLDARLEKVESVMLDGQPIPFTHDGQTLKVTLPSPQSRFALQLKWTTPRERTWAGYQTSAWLPTLMDPSQRVTAALTLRAPDGWKVVLADGDRPVPPFLLAFAAGPFQEASRTVDGVTLRVLAPSGEHLEDALDRITPMYRFLVERLGPARGHYTQVFVPGEAAQEAAGLALIGESALTDRDDEWVLSHELAHQWFGVQVACLDFGDFWLNEGFATFLVAAVAEHLHGRAAYDAELANWRARSAKVTADRREAPLSLAPPGQPRPLVRDSELQARGVTYFRGALVLHRLRELLGEEKFWAALKHYAQSRSGRSATSEELRAALEASSGVDLRSFFEHHVYAPVTAL